MRASGLGSFGIESEDAGLVRRGSGPLRSLVLLLLLLLLRMITSIITIIISTITITTTYY